jgi:hypothetical protein
LLLLLLLFVGIVRLLSLYCRCFSVNSFVVVDIKDAIFMMAVDIVACMAIEYDNIHRVAYARK